MDKIHGNMICIQIKAAAEPSCIFVLFCQCSYPIPQIIFITQVLLPDSKGHFHITQNQFLELQWHYLFFGVFFREYSGCFDMHSSHFFSDSQVMNCFCSVFHGFGSLSIKFLHFICDDFNPVQFQTSEIERRIIF